MIQSLPLDGLTLHPKRSEDVTASVAGALLGVHPWVTALELYNLKAKISKEDSEDTPAMRRGRVLEPVAVSLLRLDRPDWVIEYPVNRYYRDVEHRIGATPDALIIDEFGRKGIVQIKTVMPYGFKAWSAEAGIEPPPWIAIQAIIEARLTGAEVAYVLPFLFDDRLLAPALDVPLHDAIYERIKIEVAEFWQRIREDRPYAPDYKRDGALIAKMYPEDKGYDLGTLMDNLLPGMVDQLVLARQTKRAAEKLEDEAKAYITHQMGAASYASLPDGRRISNKLQKRDVKCKHVEGEFCSQSQYRVARITNP